MKFKLKIKLIKLTLKFLSILALFGAIIAGSIYEIISNNYNISHKQPSMINHADVITNNNQPTINDVVNGDVNSLSQSITTIDKNYILPTLNKNKIPGLLKINSFVIKQYGINFNNFKNYHVRQIVQNYNDQNQYFVLLVNTQATVTVNVDTTNKKINFTNITNPGHVLVVQDKGSGFNITADYQLDAPILDQNMFDYYANMYFQQSLGPTQTLPFNKTNGYNEPWSSLSPRYTGIGAATVRNNQFPNFVISSLTSLKKINESWLNYQKQTGTTTVGKQQIPTFASYPKNVASYLYLNSMNNMVFVSNKTNDTGSDAIYLFGGNRQINLWFYTFTVNDNQANSLTSPIKEYASSYANYRIWFENILNADGTDKVDSPLLSSDIETQKAYNNSLNISQRPTTTNPIPASWNNNPYKDASFFGYYVAGAKFVDKPTPQIELALTIPNFALFNNNQPVLLSTNVNFWNKNKYTQPPQSSILNIYGSISTDVAIETTRYRNQQVSSYQSSNSWKSSSTWPAKYTNSNYSFVNVTYRDAGSSTYNVTSAANDGYLSVSYNKLVTYFPVSFEDNNVVLKYQRDKIIATVLSQNDKPSYTAQLSLQNQNTSMRNLTNIWRGNNSWFFAYKSRSNTKSTVYNFSYNPQTKLANFIPINLQLSANLDVLNILPLSTNFIYVLAKDVSTNQVTPLLYQIQNKASGIYKQNLAFNNLLNDNTAIQANGIPNYATYNEGQNEWLQTAAQQSIWGTVKFKDINYLIENGLLSKSLNDLVNDQETLKSLVDFTPGWTGQDIKVTTNVNDNNELEIAVSIKYFNGNYYSPEQLSAINALTQVYQGFGTSPNQIGTLNNNGNNSNSTVIIIAIVIPILILGILVGLGLGFGIPILKIRKLKKILDYQEEIK